MPVVRSAVLCALKVDSSLRFEAVTNSYTLDVSCCVIDCSNIDSSVVSLAKK